MSFDDDLQEPLLERLSASPEPESADEDKSKKRKRSAKGDAQKPAKKAKSKKKIVEDEELDFELGLNKAFSHMDNQLLADYVAQRTRKFESDLSSIELEEKYISAGSFRDSTSYEKDRTLDNLPSFLETFSTNPTKLWGSSKKNGTPHTIIVASAGLRAADVARVIRKFQAKDSHVAKLFAKHIKVQESIKFLQSHRTGIAVGTPQRLMALMTDGALAVDRLERIVIDASHIDQKKRGVFEMKETQVPLMQWLNSKQLKERYGATKDGIDLLVY